MPEVTAFHVVKSQLLVSISTTHALRSCSARDHRSKHLSLQDLTVASNVNVTCRVAGNRMMPNRSHYTVIRTRIPHSDRLPFTSSSNLAKMVNLPWNEIRMKSRVGSQAAQMLFLGELASQVSHRRSESLSLRFLC